MTAQIIYGTDFRAKSNRDRAFWIGPNPLEIMAMTLTTTALMGDAWFQAAAGIALIDTAPSELNPEEPAA